MRINTFLLGMACLAFSLTAFAQASWEVATLVDNVTTDSPESIRCVYQTLGGNRYSIIVNGNLCPLTVTVNTETGEVERK